MSTTERTTELSCTTRVSCSMKVSLFPTTRRRALGGHFRRSEIGGVGGVHRLQTLISVVVASVEKRKGSWPLRDFGFDLF